MPVVNHGTDADDESEEARSPPEPDERCLVLTVAIIVVLAATRSRVVSCQKTV